MKKKHFLIIPAAALGLQLPLAAQEHEELAHAASKVDKNGEYYQLNKVDQDIKVIMKYLDLVLKIARDSGEDIPAELDMKKLVDTLGLGDIKAMAQSSKYQNNAWLNKSYLETGSSSKGIFSLFGGPAKPFTVTQFAPAGTDLAMQIQLDLTKVENMAMTIANLVGENDKVKTAMSTEIPDLKMTPSQLLAKLNVTLNVAVDLDGNNRMEMGPMKVGRPEVIGRIDGLAWAWDIVGDQIIEGSELPFEKSVKGNVISYSLADEVRPHMENYSPTIVVDKGSNQVWVCSDKKVLAASRGNGPKLADSQEFKATWKGLPQEGNSMFYISKELVNEIKSQYDALADQEAFGDDFKKARPLIDEVIKDLTKCKTGYGAAISREDRGILLANKAPLPSWVGKAVSSALPYLMMKEKEKENNKTIRARPRD